MSHKKDASRRNVAAMARVNASEAMETLVKAMRGPDLRVAVDAANDILDRAIGKPVAMTADVTDRLDEFDDAAVDAAIADLEGRIGVAAKAEGEAGPDATTH